MKKQNSVFTGHGSSGSCIDTGRCMATARASGGGGLIGRLLLEANEAGAISEELRTVWREEVAEIATNEKWVKISGEWDVGARETLIDGVTAASLCVWLGLALPDGTGGLIVKRSGELQVRIEAHANAFGRALECQLRAAA